MVVFGIVYQSDEVHQLPHPVWLIGSAAAGTLMFLVGLFALTSIHETEHYDPKEMHASLSKVLGAMCIAACETVANLTLSCFGGMALCCSSYG